MRAIAAIAALVLLFPAITRAALPPEVPTQRHPASRSVDGLWTDISEGDLAARNPAQRMLVPRAARTLSLNAAAFLDIAAGAPLEFTAGAESLAPIITLPMPDGAFERFAIEESPVIDGALAAQLPRVRTYRAEGIDDRQAFARIDFTAEGFHGFIISPAGTVYIDPYRRGDTAHYMSYWRRDYERPTGMPAFHCESRPHASPHGATARGFATRGSSPLASSGPTLRTYRLAVACTGEYAAYYGGTVSGAQNGMITTINRVNGIYEKELAVRLTMVNNTSIVFTNALTDPFSNTDADIDVNQTVIDANIGSANYDVGHLVGTGGGGIAYQGVVCDPAYKARGLTGSSSPISDAFDVDYVAHEIGHQFGGSHTFNGTSLSCGGGNRADYAAYEPGSGSTIMAYAGICSPENLQPHSDPYFHAKSFDEITAYLSDFASCAVQTGSGNSAPVVNAGVAVTIPASTPFSLTGSATDANGDALTFCWEEFDLGTASPPNTDDGSRPIFRSFPPTVSSTRTFPRLSDILTGTTTLGESLPSTGRTMTFRLTARDNKAGGGGVSSATTTVTVVGTAGPFAVTQPSAASSWAGGAFQPVMWTVNSTNLAPVNCAKVAITLSTNGGTSFDTTLLASTDNDNTESILVPNVPTTNARVKVACTTAPFFNISPTFTITQSPPAPQGFSAVAIDPAIVQLSWNGTSTADTYEIYRSPSGQSFSKIYTMVLSAPQIGNTGIYTFNEGIGLAADRAYLYYLRAVTAGKASPPSNTDLATTVVFADDPIQAGVTPVRATHLTQIRTAVDAVHVLAGLGHVTFTDPSPAGVAVKALHFSELRTALNDARTALGLPAITYTNDAAAGTAIRAVDMTEMRTGVK